MTTMARYMLGDHTIYRALRALALPNLYAKQSQNLSATLNTLYFFSPKVCIFLEENNSYCYNLKKKKKNCQVVPQDSQLVTD